MAAYPPAPAPEVAPVSWVPASLMAVDAPACPASATTWGSKGQKEVTATDHSRKGQQQSTATTDGELGVDIQVSRQTHTATLTPKQKKARERVQQHAFPGTRDAAPHTSHITERNILIDITAIEHQGWDRINAYRLPEPNRPPSRVDANA